MALLDRWFDAAAGLICLPNTGRHDTRASVYYALGLLRRNGSDASGRAEAILRVVSALQWHCPGQPWHGTFARFPEEFVERQSMRVWHDYDPNWREFLGTAFILLLDRYRDRLSDPAATTLEQTLTEAAEGAYTRDVPAGYTNAALMSAFLLVWCGARFREPSWSTQGERLARQIHERYSRHETFPEYNSPTYYGVDLCALVLWRSRMAPQWMRALGTTMERGLWGDIARFFNPSLGTLCGPWLRSYGMDMNAYCALLGLWIAAATDERLVPLPRFDQPFGHAHDIAFAPLVAELADTAGVEAARQLDSASLPRTLSRPIRDTLSLTATAHLAQDIMLGGLSASEGLARKHAPQCYPGTVHWRTPSGPLGWLRVFADQPLDVTAKPGVLSVRALADDEPQPRYGIGMEVSVPGGVKPDVLRSHAWRLPGLTVDITTATAVAAVESDGSSISAWFDADTVNCRLQAIHTMT
ncbi:MAG: hypothetical protein GF331_13820 [Chitinivibrionales bacterium]|nr:hypothetical protein [Chitinivibrionales bacterium]